MVLLFMLNNFRMTHLRILLVAALFFSACILKAETAGQEVKSKPDSSKEKKYNAGEMILEHIGDAYEWHIITVGETHVAIPLPVILIDDGKLVVFSSSHFHHGTEAYRGYSVATDEANKGKIIKTLSNGSAVLPIDLSITKNTLSLFIVLILLCVIFISVANRYKKHPNEPPRGLQSIVEIVIVFIRDDIVKPAIGEKKYGRYMPYLLSLFFFIFFGNLLGLIPFFPGGANLTGNIAITMVLALFTFIITSFSAKKSYWIHIINTPGVPWWLKFPLPLMPIVELIGVITKPFVLMVRLFANITAGHIIALGFFSLIFIFGEMSAGVGYGSSIVAVIFTVFMGLLELLVAFLQAYVFTLLSSLYFGMAVEEHEHHEEHAH
jgi:F-type H+-transporting ATPase subunit a